MEDTKQSPCHQWTDGQGETSIPLSILLKQGVWVNIIITGPIHHTTADLHVRCLTRLYSVWSWEAWTALEMWPRPLSFSTDPLTSPWNNNRTKYLHLKSGRGANAFSQELHDFWSSQGLVTPSRKCEQANLKLVRGALTRHRRFLVVASQSGFMPTQTTMPPTGIGGRNHAKITTYHCTIFVISNSLGHNLSIGTMIFAWQVLFNLWSLEISTVFSDAVGAVRHLVSVSWRFSLIRVKKKMNSEI